MDHAAAPTADASRIVAKPEPRQKKPAIAAAPAEPAAIAKAGTFPIVGIGASAGGLEAFEQFFSHLPPDSGMAFVIVMHLDPTGHSLMPEILTRFTKMPIRVAGDSVVVEPNSVYLIPPNKDMGLRGGALFLKDLPQPPGLKLPVDFFFRSLADAKGPDAIGVILSGTGSDGTLGVQAVKAAMGAVFVQDPASAKYDGMPKSAIATGLADFVLKPEDMPKALIQFVEHTAVTGSPAKTSEKDTREPLQRIFTAIRARTGHDFSSYKKSTILRRIERRMSVHQVGNLEAYVQFLKDNENEPKALLKDFLISVTNFFRDPAAFAELKREFKETLQTKDEGAILRVWVPGCATGEEAYSIAMIVTECMGELKKNFTVQVFGTDIDAAALKIARAGLYPANIAADVSPAQLKRFFTIENGNFRINKELRDMVIFAPHDLIKDPPFSRMDLILCRNLLIYLESELQKQILPLLHYALKPGGILFLGLSETNGAAADLFTPLSKKWKIYRRREAAVVPGRLKFPSSIPTPRRPVPGEPPPVVPAARIPAVAERIFLDRYAPTFAVIDDKYHLVYVRGKTGKYLEIASGQPSLSLLDMAREGLRTELASLLHRAAAEKKTVTAEGLRIKNNGGFQSLNLTVAPLDEPGLPAGSLLVVFQDKGAAAPEVKTARSDKNRTQVAALEEEHKLTRENLQASVEELEATNEELKSANEELQSNNEELQSSNEELDTSQEELQSVNEELTTLNAELQNNNESLTQANDDLKNFLARTDIAILFLDEELRIRSYTPASADVFKIREVDVGRPIDEISSRLAYDKLAIDARAVLRSHVAKEVEPAGGQTLVHHAHPALPYREGGCRGHSGQLPRYRQAKTRGAGTGRGQ